MTATDELRRLLDERSVEWMPSVFDPQHETFYDVNGVGFIVTEFPEIERMSLACDMRITPAQAIAATLGVGTCKVDVLNTGDCAGYDCSEYIMHCNACGHEFGHVLYNEDGDVWMSERPNYCPNCGRRVKVVDE